MSCGVGGAGGIGPSSENNNMYIPLFGLFTLCEGFLFPDILFRSYSDFDCGFPGENFHSSFCVHGPRLPTIATHKTTPSVQRSKVALHQSSVSSFSFLNFSNFLLERTYKL